MGGGIAGGVGVGVVALGARTVGAHRVSLQEAATTGRVVAGAEVGQTGSIVSEFAGPPQLTALAFARATPLSCRADTHVMLWLSKPLASPKGPVAKGEIPRPCSE